MPRTHLPTRADVLAALLADGADGSGGAGGRTDGPVQGGGALRALLHGGGLTWVLEGRAQRMREMRARALSELPPAWAALAECPASSVQVVCEVLGMRAMDHLRSRLVLPDPASGQDVLTHALAHWHQATTGQQRLRRASSIGRMVLLAALAGLDATMREAVVRSSVTNLGTLWQDRGQGLVGAAWISGVAPTCEAWLEQALRTLPAPGDSAPGERKEAKP